MAGKEELQIVVRMKDLVSKGFGRVAKNGARMVGGLMRGVRGLIRRFLSLKTLLLGIGTVLVARFFGDMTTSAAESLEMIDLVAKRSNVTTKSIQEMAFATKNYGMNIEQLADALKDFALRQGDAVRMSKAQRDAFNKLGIDVEELTSDTVDVTEVFKRIAEGMKNLGTQNERLRLLQDIFGESAVRLMPLFREGAAGIEEWAQKAEEFGVVFDKGVIQRASAFLVAKNEFLGAWNAIKVQILDQLFPLLKNVLTDLAKFLAKNKDEIVKDMVALTKAIAVGLANILAAIADFVAGWNRLAAQFGGGPLASLQEHLETTRTIMRSLNKEMQEVAKGQQEIVKSLEPQLKVAEQVFGKGSEQAKHWRDQLEASHAAAEQRLADLRGALAEWREDERRTISQITEARELKSFEALADKIRNIAQQIDEYAPGGKAKQGPTPMTGLVGDGETKEGGGYFSKLREGIGKATEDYANNALDLVATVNQATMSMYSGLETHLSQGLSDVIMRTKSLKEAWKDTGRAIIQMLVQIIAKMTVMRALGGPVSWLGGLFGDGGGSDNPGAFGGGGGGDAPGGAGVGVPLRASATGPVNISFNILANDTRGFDELLVRRRALIEDIIANGLRHRRSLISGVRQA